MRLLPALALISATLCAAAEAPAPGDPLPPVSVLDAAGAPQTIRFNREGQATVLIFLSTRCPVANAYLGRLGSLADEYRGSFRFFAINATREESLAEVNDHRTRHKIPFPVYKDVRSRAAHRLGSSVTPEVYVTDSHGVLRYHGRVDDHQNPARVTDHTLERVLDSMRRGLPPPVAEAKAFGCAMPMWSEE